MTTRARQRCPRAGEGVARRALRADLRGPAPCRAPCTVHHVQAPSTRLSTSTDGAHSRLLQAHEIGRLLDEAMPEADVRELQEAEDVCRRFLAVDLLTDEGCADVLASGAREMLERVLGVDAGSPAGSQRSVTV
jgi:hypothetical protein